MVSDDLEKMKSILQTFGFAITEMHRAAASLPFFSTTLTISNPDLSFLNISLSGKGLTRRGSMVSAYGELFERLQNNFLFTGHHHALQGRKNHTDMPDHCLSRMQIADAQPEFYLAPDERFQSLDVLTANPFIELVTLLPHHLVDDDGYGDVFKEYLSSLLCTPFYSVHHGEIGYCPMELMLFSSGSTGCAAGYSLAHAVQKSIFEICERYVFRQLFSEDLTPPEIPLTRLEGTEAEKVIKEIESKHKTVVRLLDCSFGEGFPVAGVMLINRDRNLYNCNLGAAETLSTSVIQALTELYDGNDDFYGLPISGYRNPYQADTPDLASFFRYSNYYTAKANSTGLWPKSLFGTTASWEQESEKVWNKNLASNPLRELLDLLRRKGKKLYLRDVSYLGIPSVYGYIPGMSNVNYCSGKNELIDILTLKEASGKLKKSINRTSVIMQQILALYKKTGETALPAPASFLSTFSCWNYPGSRKIREHILLAAISQLFGHTAIADEVLQQLFLAARTASNSTLALFAHCVIDYHQLIADECPTSALSSQLLRFYRSEVVEQAMLFINDPMLMIQEVFENHDFPDNKPACTSCSFVVMLQYVKKLHSFYKDHQPDQENLAHVLSVASIM